MPARYPYKRRTNSQGTEIKSHAYRTLRTNNLKEIYIIRYADGFKIFCRNYYDTERTYQAVTKWLQDRLKLNVSEEKSKITNLKQKYSEFSRFRLKVKLKGKKFVIQSHISDKALKSAKENISKYVVDIERPANEKEQYRTIAKYNATVSGLHNYYQVTTNVNLDFARIAFHIRKQTNNRLDTRTSGTLDKGFIKEEYGKSKQLCFLSGHPLIPVGYIRIKDVKHKRKVINKYIVKGRAFIHKDLQVDVDTLVWLTRHPVLDKSIKFADNRVSLFAVQYDRYEVTSVKLTPNGIYYHHKIPLKQGGTDSYNNLVLVTEAVRILIHATGEDTIQKYIEELDLTAKQIEKCNKLRKMTGLPLI